MVIWKQYFLPHLKEPREPYKFDYAVKDEYDDYGRQEESDGKVVSGSYFVHLPDGRKQIVTYRADPYTGFQADVQYEGEAKYPEYVPPKQSYKAEPAYPRPSYPSKPAYPEPSYPVKKPAYEPEPEYRPRPAYPAQKY